MSRRVEVRVIVLNGTSSSGKTSLARSLQTVLGPGWLTFGIDDLITALPQVTPEGREPAISFASDGSITLGDDFRAAEYAWYQGLAAIAKAGAGLILDEVFLGGGASQARVRSALSGLTVVWVGVLCDVDVAEARERARGDRFAGMARRQEDVVHAGVDYDLTVDTTEATSLDCAEAIAAHLTLDN